MKDYKEYIDRLHKNLCYTRDPEIRHSGCLEKFIGKYGKPFLKAIMEPSLQTNMLQKIIQSEKGGPPREI